jgi:hypothetical protein
VTERGLRAGSRRRRIAAVVALGALAVGVLSACRSDAGSAAFVGNTRFTDAQVATGVSNINLAQFGNRSDAQRVLVVDLVYTQVLQHYAAENKITLPQPTAEALSAIATKYSVSGKHPEQNLLVQSEAKASAWTAALVAKATPVTPTDAQLQPIFGRAILGGLATADGFAAFKTNISAVPDFTASFGLGQALAKSEAGDNVEISPRYAPACTAAPCAGFQYPIEQLGDSDGTHRFDAVVLNLGPALATPAVVDVPTPAASSSSS